MSRLLLPAALALLLAGTGPAAAQTGIADVDTRIAFTLDRADRVAPAGDVDGDGTADLLVWADDPDEGATEVRVVLGGDRVPGLRAFRLAGVRSDVLGGPSGAGDVNGDGRADLAVPVDDPRGAAIALVLGRTAPRDVDVRRAGERDALVTVAESGAFATGVGDVNGDGIGDLAVTGTASNADEPDGSVRGRGAIVFGRRDLRGTIATARASASLMIVGRAACAPPPRACR